MYYECNLDSAPVSCEIVEWDLLTGWCLIEYTDPTSGLLRKWVDGDKISGRTPAQEISQ